jgi:hypothetical protein
VRFRYGITSRSSTGGDEEDGLSMATTDLQQETNEVRQIGLFWRRIPNKGKRRIVKGSLQKWDKWRRQRL